MYNSILNFDYISFIFGTEFKEATKKPYFTSDRYDYDSDGDNNSSNNSDSNSDDESDSDSDIDSDIDDESDE